MQNLLHFSIVFIILAYFTWEFCKESCIIEVISQSLIAQYRSIQFYGTQWKCIPHDHINGKKRVVIGSFCWKFHSTFLFKRLLSSYRFFFKRSFRYRFYYLLSVIENVIVLVELKSWKQIIWNESCVFCGYYWIGHNDPNLFGWINVCLLFMVCWYCWRYI